MAEAVKDAFQGKKSSQVISTSEGDIIIAALPDKKRCFDSKNENSFRNNEKS